MSRSKLADAAVIALEGVLAAGLYTFAAPCPVKNGHFMACHWAVNVSVSLAAVLILLSIIRFFSSEVLFRRGVNVAVLLTAALQLGIPGFIVNICRHEHMRCCVYSQPAIVTVAGLVVLIAVSGLILDRKASA